MNEIDPLTWWGIALMFAPWVIGTVYLFFCFDLFRSPSERTPDNALDSKTTRRSARE